MECDKKWCGHIQDLYHQKMSTSKQSAQRCKTVDSLNGPAHFPFCKRIHSHTNTYTQCERQRETHKYHITYAYIAKSRARNRNCEWLKMWIKERTELINRSSLEAPQLIIHCILPQWNQIDTLFFRQWFVLSSNWVENQKKKKKRRYWL